MDPIDSGLKTRHYGQMTARFPLSHSQRISLSLLDRCEIYQVMAVNGPPGTGKTTLIQSIAADLLVKFFLADSKPPIIIGSSANNKAITNILDSFASVSPRGGDRLNLNQRWLPDLDILGQYLAANNAEKLETARRAGHWVSTCGTKGFDAYHEYCTAHSKGSCEEYLLKKLLNQEDYTGDADLQKGLTWIRQEVKKLCSQIDDVSSSLDRLRKACRSPELKDISLLSLPSAIESRIESLRKKREPLDNSIQREKLRRARPGFLLRLVDRLTKGPMELRRARLQSDLLIKDDGSINLDQLDFYALSQEIWKVRDNLFQTENKLIRAWTTVERDYDRIAPYIISLDPGIPCGLDTWIEAVQGKLDVGERHKAFWWSLHGYEAQWLLLRDDNRYWELNQGQSQSLQRWQERSFLTPMFVSTFHSMPHFLTYSKKTPDGAWVNIALSGSVDLLIVDEAGQVAPELGVPVFGLAKRALVVGDVLQLEPIWNIPSKAIDFSNASRAGIVSTQEQYEAFSQSRRGCMNGSLMVLAQNASPFLHPDHWKEAGSLLVEHRRCVPGIIEYSNRFIYQSLLEIQTQAEKSTWPALGYCHIAGESRKFKSSQSNLIEARAIAAWIRQNKEQLSDRYQAKLADVLAIITPFRGQQTAILEALNVYNIDIKGLVVGTVHSLQGAEKPVVIFSPVYGRNHSSGQLFFNQSYNMLNVATTRAKQHFLVFGNMVLFKTNDYNSPAGDLGQLLFRSPENQIPNDFLFKEAQIEFFDRHPIDRLDTLQMHRASLRRAFEIAQKRLVVVSPFISNSALQADEIPGLVASARKRNVEVIVLTDDSLDKVQGTLRPQAEEGHKALTVAGAKLMVMSGIHNKTLIIDHQVLIEGSFNWLSAVRDESSPYSRHETSIVIKTPHCDRFIARAEIELGLSTWEDTERV